MDHLALYLFLGISALSVIATVYDKIAAKCLPRNRVPEATLLLLAALGGSLPMYIAMQIIHHKTQHKKFMIGIPVILAVQVVLMILYFYFLH